MDAVRKASELMFKNRYKLFLLMIFILTLGCSKNTNTNITSTSSSEVASSTPIVTLTTTPFQHPLLSLDEAQSELQNLLVNNGGCQLPCFWNITPGNNTFQELVTILNPLSKLSSFTQFEPYNGTISPGYTKDELLIHTSIQYLADPSTKVITAISFNAAALNKIGDTFTYVFDSLDFNKSISYYMLNNILAVHGRPTTVMVSTMAKLPTNGAISGGFDILLLYPDQGILANYNMKMVPIGEDIVGCPSKSHVELNLFPLSQTEKFFSHLEESGWRRLLYNAYKPIDEVTSMTINEFYKTFSQPTDKCISTPANLWPIPD